MRDVIDSVLMKANCLDEINLYFVPGSNSANEILSGPLHRLGYREDGRDVVRGMRIVRTQKGVMHVQFADRRGVRPGRPLRTKTLLRYYAEYSGAVVARMAKSHRPGCNDWGTVDRGDRHSGVVDDAVNDEFSHIGLNRDDIGCNAGNFPGELFFAWKLCFGGIDPYRMDLHFRMSTEPRRLRSCRSPLQPLRKKSSSTATLGCASMISAAKPAQARVPVPLKAALN